MDTTAAPIYGDGDDVEDDDEAIPYDMELESRTRFRRGLPLAVYSCWNGIVALDAKPFLGIGVDGERSGTVALDAEVRFRGAARKKQECGASSCLSRDGCVV